MTQTNSPIPTPASRRMQRGLLNWLPIATFVVMIGLCGWLAQYQQRATLLVGEVEIAEFVVGSPQTGVISQILPGSHESNPVYSTVKEGQLLARLDDTAVRNQLYTIEKELLSLARGAAVELARVDAGAAPREVHVAADVDAKPLATTKKQDSATQLSKELQAWRVAAAATERQLQQLELTRRELDLRSLDFELTSTHSTAAVTNSLQQRKSDLELTIAKLRTELAFEQSAGSVGIGDSLSNVDESSLSAAGRSLYRSFRRRCQLAQSQWKSVAKSARSLDVLSPADGQIDKTHVGQLEAVVLGAPVITVVPNRGSYVIAYAREQSTLRPFEGMEVTLRSSSDRRQKFSSVVESVGPKVESIPSRQRATRIEEYGRPVRIPIPKEMFVEPGSLLEISFGTSNID